PSVVDHCVYCMAHSLYPGSPLSPYTTLFRSVERQGVPVQPSQKRRCDVVNGHDRSDAQDCDAAGADVRVKGEDERAAKRSGPPRSEEHTSELQSRENLVCRLLLENKNNNIFL